MPIDQPNQELLHGDDFADFAQWHHEGVGEIQRGPDGAMRLRCLGSVQGSRGCMTFFRPTLPDQVAIEYDIALRSAGGLVINYLAIRGLRGEDLIEDRAKLPPRTGVMRDYWCHEQGLQSYHLSFCRFNDKGEHTQTSNWRRNPGGLMVGHGVDPVTQIGRRFHVRLTKDRGSCQFYADERFAHGFVDWRSHPLPIPDHGKFGFRLVGADVSADFWNFRVYRIRAETAPMAIDPEFARSLG
jgi:hypothetical protein